MCIRDRYRVRISIRVRIRVWVWVRVSVVQRCIGTIVNTIINLEYGWYIEVAAGNGKNLPSGIL